MIRIAKLITRAWRREDGTAAVEFVLALPVIMAIFMASFESGLVMVRSIMLEQSLDIVMRELRLGHLRDINGATTTARVKTEICNRTVIFPDCTNDLRLQLTKVDTSNGSAWALPTPEVTCVDSSATEIDPSLVLQIGAENDLMIVRACIRLRAIFPTTGIGLGLDKDSQGAYKVVARSAFSIEPS
jgi:Flp pilus assembly protein TadG